MKLKLAMLTAVALVFGASSVQAVDTGTPDILSSVSSNSVQLLTKAESAEIRGEYWTCWNFSVPQGSRCAPQFSRTQLPSSEDHGHYTITRTSWGQWGNLYVSR